MLPLNTSDFAMLFFVALYTERYTVFLLEYFPTITYSLNVVDLWRLCFFTAMLALAFVSVYDVPFKIVPINYLELCGLCVVTKCVVIATVFFAAIR
jgi:hypothetical protein